MFTHHATIDKEPNEATKNALFEVVKTGNISYLERLVTTQHFNVNIKNNADESLILTAFRFHQNETRSHLKSTRKEIIKVLLSANLTSSSTSEAFRLSLQTKNEDLFDFLYLKESKLESKRVSNTSTISTEEKNASTSPLHRMSFIEKNRKPMYQKIKALDRGREGDLLASILQPG